jgi:hypothetical protein
MKLLISPATLSRIARHALLPFRDTSKRAGEGLLEIDVERDVWEHVRSARVSGESDDDVLNRLLDAAAGIKPS